MVTFFRLSAVLAAGLLLAGNCVAQSSSRSTYSQRGSQTTRQGSQTSGGARRVQTSEKTFEQKLWDYLKSARYQQWSPVPGTTGDPTPGQSPHGAMLKMYLNRKAAGHVSDLPDGSIVIKENYGPEGKQLMAITVMYRAKGYNPDAGDWYWVKYLPDGSVDVKQTENGSMRLAGRVQGCIECHSSAAGGDYAFLNDPK